MPKACVLFISSNPSPKKLKFDWEIENMRVTLAQAKARDNFEIDSRWAVTKEGLIQALAETRPTIVHISAHGCSEGILLQDEIGQPDIINAQSMAHMFKVFVGTIRCVLLSACYSVTHASAISQYVPYVVGMNSRIKDAAARAFCSGFYKGYFASKDIEHAFELGKVAIEVKLLEGENVPELMKGECLSSEINEESSNFQTHASVDNCESTTNERFNLILDNVYRGIVGFRHGDQLESADHMFDAAPLRHYINILKSSPEITLLPSLLGKTEQLPVSSMYVDIAVSQSKISPMPELLEPRFTMAQAMQERHRCRKARRASVNEALDDSPHKHIVILGDPGGGKTSLLKRVAIDIVEGKWRKWLIPFLVPLRLYWRAKQRQNDLTLTQYVTARILSAINSPQYHLNLSLDDADKQVVTQQNTLDVLLALISGANKNHIVFLLDGFDEIAADKIANEQICMEINQLSYAYSWILTSRRAGFNGGINADIRFEIVELDDDNITVLVNNWFSHQSFASGSHVQSVLNQVFANDRLLMMARNPFLLTLLCYLQSQSTDRLPLTRHQVYEQVFASVTEHDENRFGQQALTSEGVCHLGEFCLSLYIHMFKPPRHLFNTDDWLQFDSQYRKPDLVKELCPSRLIDQWADRSIYHLVHLTLHEYLVAKALFDRPVETAVNHVHHPAWRVVLRFLASMYWHNGKQDCYIQLLSKVLEPMDLNGMMLIEAAHILVEAGIEDSTPIIGYDLREKLWSQWLTDQPYIADAVADALSVLAPNLAIARCIGLIESPETKIDASLTSRQKLISAIQRQTRNLSMHRSQHHRAISFLGRIRHKDAHQYLFELIEEQPQGYGNVAADALAWHNVTAVRQQAKQRLKHLALSDEKFAIYCRLTAKMAHSDFIDVLCHRLTECDEAKAQLILRTLENLPSETTATSIIDWYLEHKGNLRDEQDVFEALVKSHSQSTKDFFFDMYHNGAVEQQQLALTYLVEAGYLPTGELLQILDGDDMDAIESIVEMLGEQAEQGIEPSQFLIERTRQLLDDNPTCHLLFEAYAKLVVGYFEHQQVNLAGSFFRKHLQSQHYSETTDFRSMAAYTCGRLKDLVAQPLLIEATQSTQIELKVNAVGALAKLDATPQVFALLHSLLQSETKILAEAAADALAELDFAQIASLPRNSMLNDSLSRVSSEKGLLIFKNYYVDRMGITTGWTSKSNIQATTLFLSFALDDAPFFVGLFKHLSDEGIAIELDNMQKADMVILCVGQSGLQEPQKDHFKQLLERQKNNELLQVKVLLLNGALLPIQFADQQWPSLSIQNAEDIIACKDDILQFLRG